MSRDTASYVGLIPAFDATRPKFVATRPKFVATIQASVDPLARMQVALREMATQDFDLDTAVGAQLDAVGVRVGRSRHLTLPLQGIFFAWDDPARGWDKGIWQGPYSAGDGLYTIDDDEVYRRLLRATILANTWDGTIVGAQAILDAYFVDPATRVFVEDQGYAALNPFFAWDDPARGWDQGVWQGPNDSSPSAPLQMAMVIGIAGKLPSLIDLGLLEQGAFGIKPIGVSLDYRVTSVNNAPVFGWDMSNEYISGWDQGAWGVDPDYIAGNVIASAA